MITLLRKFIWIPRWTRVPARLKKVCTCLRKCYIPIRMWLISLEPDTWNRLTESIKVIIHLQSNSWKVCGEKKKEIRTSASTKEEQLARMVTNALQVASEWPSVFMTILVSSYAPAVSTLKLWWICNVIDLFWGFPFFFTRSPRLSFCTLLSLLLSRHEQQFVNAEQTRKR